MATVTCHTEGCGNAGHALDVGGLTSVDEETGETIVAAVVCGVCGQPIEDVKD